MEPYGLFSLERGKRIFGKESQFLNQAPPVLWPDEEHEDQKRRDKKRGHNKQEVVKKEHGQYMPGWFRLLDCLGLRPEI